MQKQNMILLVDAETKNRAALSGLLQDTYHILQAKNGKQALLLLKQYHSNLAVMLLNVALPDQDGYQFLGELRENGLMDTVPVVAIVPQNAVESAARAIDLGAADSIAVPFSPPAVLRRLENIISLSEHKRALNSMVTERAEKLQESNELLIDALCSAIESRSPESKQHIRRVHAFTKALLQEIARSCPEYGLDAHMIKVMTSAAALHDIGKIAVPDHILQQDGPLTDADQQILKTHTIKGCEILQSLHFLHDQEYLRYAYNICRYHHERWDGNGYPDGLRGDDIPICAQAAGLADEYDTLTSGRSRLGKFRHEQAAVMILNGSRGAFSPKLLECMKNVLPQFAALLQDYAGSSPASPVNPPLPSSESAALSAFQREHLKFIAMARHTEATVFELNLSDNGFHLLYSSSPGSHDLLRENNFHDLLDKHMNRLVHPDDVPLVHRIWQEDVTRFLAEGGFRNSWFYRVHDLANPSALRCRMTMLRINTENPDDHRVLLLFEQSPAEDSMQPTEQTENLCYRLLDGVVHCKNDAALTIERINSVFLGYTQQELHDKFQNQYINLIHEDDRARVRLQLRQLSVGAHYEIEYRVCRRDGETAWVLNRGQLVTDEHGHETLYNVLLNIDSSKQAQEALRLSLDRYHIIMNQTNDVVFERDIATDRMIYSSVWQAKFGYEPIQDHASARILSASHLHPDDTEAAKGLLQEMQDGLPYGELDIRIANAQGLYQWCRIRATAQFNSNGHLCKVIGVLVDIDDAKKNEQKLQFQAERDLLTGLYNKTSARNRIESHLQQRGNKDGMVLFVIDIDNFKHVNDRYGHLFGDAVLSKVASAVSRLFCGEDIIGRIGGDEFVVALQGGLDNAQVELVSGRLIRCFEEALLDLPVSCHVTCSVGVARAPQDGIDFQTLFQRADTALYVAKAHGKNQYILYDPSIEGAAFDSAASESSVRTQIDSDALTDADLCDLIPGVFRVLNNARDPHKAIHMMLTMVGRRLSVSRVHIFEESVDGQSCSNTYEWCAEGIISQKDDLQNLSYAQLGFPYHELFNERDLFYCSDVDTLPAPLRKAFRASGVQSILQCALRRDGRFYGWIGFEDCVKQFLWTQTQINVLSFISELLSLFLAPRFAHFSEYPFANIGNERRNPAETENIPFQPPHNPEK
ncbi:MAG: diguanylate cyclase [Intestinibacillus sp.]